MTPQFQPVLSHLSFHAGKPLPERVLKSGTGVLLRALPDFLIDKANRQEVLEGRIVVVKSTRG